MESETTTTIKPEKIDCMARLEESVGKIIIVNIQGCETYMNLERASNREYFFRELNTRDKKGKQHIVRLSDISLVNGTVIINR